MIIYSKMTISRCQESIRFNLKGRLSSLYLKIKYKRNKIECISVVQSEKLPSIKEIEERTAIENTE
jgi:hypothetical protein